MYSLLVEEYWGLILANDLHFRNTQNFIVSHYSIGYFAGTSLIGCWKQYSVIQIIVRLVKMKVINKNGRSET